MPTYIQNPLKSVRVQIAQDTPSRIEREYFVRRTSARPELQSFPSYKCYCCGDTGIVKDDIFRNYIDRDYQSHHCAYRCDNCDGLQLSRQEMVEKGMNPGSENSYRVNPQYLKNFGEIGRDVCQQISRLEKFRVLALELRWLFKVLGIGFADFKVRNLIQLANLNNSKVFAHYLTQWFHQQELPDLANASSYATFCVLSEFSPPTDIVEALGSITRGVRSQYSQGFFDDCVFVQSYKQSSHAGDENTLVQPANSGLTSIQSSLNLDGLEDF